MEPLTATTASIIDIPIELIPDNTVTVTKPIRVSATLPVRGKGKISRKEGRRLAKINGSMKTWVTSRNTRLHLSSIQEEEDGNI